MNVRGVQSVVIMIFDESKIHPEEIEEDLKCFVLCDDNYVSLRHLAIAMMFQRLGTPTYTVLACSIKNNVSFRTRSEIMAKVICTSYHIFFY